MIRRIAAFFLIVLVVIPNCSFALSSHFCGGKIVESALTFGAQELSCAAVMTSETCSSENIPIPHIEAAPCCKNVKQFLDVEDRYNPKKAFSIDYSLDKVFGNTSIQFSYNYTETHSQWLFSYTPPDTDVEFIHLFQVYRL